MDFVIFVWNIATCYAYKVSDGGNLTVHLIFKLFYFGNITYICNLPVLPVYCINKRFGMTCSVYFKKNVFDVFFRTNLTVIPMLGFRPP